MDASPEPPDSLFSLSLSKGRRVQRLFVTEGLLIEDMTVGKGRWRRSWRLRDLSPDLEYTSGRPEHTEIRFVSGLVLIGLAICLYFSTLHEHVPLLAPLLGIAGAWPLGRALRSWQIETWTLIRKTDGSAATHIAHSLGKPEDRGQFEIRLVERIRGEERLGG